MAYDLRSMEGYSYRHRTPTSQQSASALSGCRYLRCKALIVITLGLLLMVAFFVSSNSAMLIVGLCVIVIGIALLFMHVVAHNLGKADPTSDSGGGINMSWNRVRYRQRNHHRSHRRDRRSSVTAQAASSSSDHVHDEADDGPPDYEMSFSVQDMMRCPEPSDWTFLPSEPPPVYFPPTTSLDTNRPVTSDDGESAMCGDPISRVYSISHRMTSPVLPSYEEAIYPRSEITTTGTDPQLEAPEVASSNHNDRRNNFLVVLEARGEASSPVPEITTTDTDSQP